MEEKTVVYKEKLNTKLLKILVKTAIIIIICILLFLFVMSFFYTAYFYNGSIIEYHEGLHYEPDDMRITISGLFVVCGTMLLSYKLAQKIDKKIVFIISLIIIAIIGFFWINFSKPPVKSDQKAVLTFATNFSKNNYNNLEKYGYLYSHPLQLGCVLGMELIIRIIHSSKWIVLQNLNVVFIMICSILLYKISEQVYQDEKNQKILSILMSMCFVLPLYSVVVYGNIYGFTFSLLAIYFLLKYYEKKNNKYLVMIPLIIGIAIMFKSNYEICAIAILISLVLDLISKFNIKTLILIVLIIVVLFGTYPLVYKIVELRTGTRPNNGIPMITYIAMSIQAPGSRNSGWYHDSKTVETIYHGNDFDSEKTVKESKEIIRNRMNEFKDNPKEAKEFYLDKIKSTWIEPAFQTFWWSEPLEEFDIQSNDYKEYVTNNKVLLSIFHGKLHLVILRYLDMIEIIVFGLSAFSLILDLKNNTYNHKKIILVLCFLGGFLFHILWETKCIYVIPFYIMLLPSAADGISKIKIENKKNFSLKKNQNNI